MLSQELLEVSQREGWTICEDIIELMTLYRQGVYEIEIYLSSAADGWMPFIKDDLKTRSVERLEEYISMNRLRYRENLPDAA